MNNLAKYSKLLPAILGVLVQLVALGVFHGSVLHYATIVISALTALGVYVAPKNAAPFPVGQR